MGRARQFPLLVFAGLALSLILAAPVSATNYAVNSNPFAVSHTKTAAALWNSYELTLQHEQEVSYSMHVTTDGACAQLLFVRGHNVDFNSISYVAYSEEHCVQSYTNTFPAKVSNSTEFTVLITSTYNGDVAYTLTISVTPPPASPWVMWLLILFAVAGVGAVVALFLVRRRKAAAVPPPAPSTASPPTGAPAVEPLAPSEPKAPPQPPPPNP